VNALGAKRLRPKVEALEERAVPSVYSDTILADGPLGYWRLGESDPSQPAMDSSGNGYNGTYFGGVTPGAPGALANDGDTAAAFDGATGFVDVPSTSGGPFNLHNTFTLEAWVINAGQAGGPSDQAGRILSNGGFAWGILNGVVDTRDGVRFTTFGHQDYDSNQTIVPEDGSWHYLAVTLDATNTATFYLDGVQTDSLPGPAPANNSGSDLFIGKNPFANAPEYFNGSIDEPTVYAYVLSPAQIANHYNVGIDQGGGASPSVVSTSLTGTVRAPVTDDIITFSEPVDPNTFTFDQFSLTDPNGNPVNVDNISTADNRTFDVTFDAQSTVGTYAVSIGPNIADFSGNPMTAPYAATFTITGALILNGDFESGSLSPGWTGTGNNVVVTSGTYGIPAHGGNYYLSLGNSGSDAVTNQTVPTTPGQVYNLEFFYFRHNDGGPSDLNVYWDGTLVYSEANLPGHDWQQYDFSVTGTGSDTLSIAARNDPWWDGIDDVSLTASPGPGPHGGSGGDQLHGQQLAAFGALAGTPVSPAAPTAPVAQAPSGWSHQASLRADQAALVDHLFSAVGTTDDTANLPSQPPSSIPLADPLGLIRLGEAPWVL
jgi:hypothetical protein